MNEYHITYELDGETGRAKITERSEAAARKDFKAHVKNGTIIDIKLAAENVLATKDQERKALETIKKIVEELGPGSYVGTAFEGCFQDAEDNIENDFGCSMKQKLESAEYDVEELKGKLAAATKRLEELDGLVDSLKDERRALETQLKAKTIPEQLRQSLYVFVSDEEDRARGSMEIAAENMATMANAPQDIAFTRSVDSYRKAKERRERCAEMVSGLEALAPKA